MIEGIHIKQLCFIIMQSKKWEMNNQEKVMNSGRFSKDIVTSIKPYKNFYLVETYHQDFYKKSSERYEQSYQASKRDVFKEKYWGE